jgi:hypothetical protein
MPAKKVKGKRMMKNDTTITNAAAADLLQFFFFTKNSTDGLLNT